MGKCSRHKTCSHYNVKNVTCTVDGGGPFTDAGTPYCGHLRLLEVYA